MAMDTSSLKAAAKPTTAVATQTQQKALTPAQRVKGMLEKRIGEIANALPKGWDEKRFVRIALTAISSNPKLAQACALSPATFLGSMMNAAQLGLEPNTPMGKAYLLPYNNIDKNTGKKVPMVQFQIGYLGYIDLAFRSGKVKSITAEVRYEKDFWEYEKGINEKLKHIPYDEGDPGEAVGYYAVIHMKDTINPDGSKTEGAVITAYMPKFRVIEHAKKFSKSYNKKTGTFSGPWASDFDSMAKKGLSLDTEIPTVEGWITMGEIEKGMTVYDMDGNPTRVIAVSEEKNIDCFEITFSNGRKVVCDDEHRWVAKIGQNARRKVRGNGWSTHTINELFDAKHKGEHIIVPLISGIKTKKATLPIDPWLLGFWIGDGSHTNGCVCCSDEDLPHIKSMIAKSGLKIGAIRKDPRANVNQVMVRGLKTLLKQNNLFGNKHIPQEYLRASAEQRLALLRGLMDSDGCMEKSRGRAIFTNTSSVIADGVRELASSLGEVVCDSTHICKGFGKSVRCRFLMWQPILNPCTLPRKADRFRAREVIPYRSIKSIKRIPSVTTKCIAVDSPTKTYLCTRDFIPTHNTVLLQALKYAPKASEDAMFANAFTMDNTVRDGIEKDASTIKTEGIFATNPADGAIEADVVEENDGEGEDSPESEGGEE